MTRIRTLAPLAAGLLAATTATAGPPDRGSAAQTVSICHAPPGNPAKARTLTVGAPAVDAHLRHGDARGACGALDQPDQPDEGAEPVPDERPEAGADPVPDERQRRRRRARRRR